MSDFDDSSGSESSESYSSDFTTAAEVSPDVGTDSYSYASSGEGRFDSLLEPIGGALGDSGFSPSMALGSSGDNSSFEGGAAAESGQRSYFGDLLSSGSSAPSLDGASTSSSAPPPSSIASQFEPYRLEIPGLAASSSPSSPYSGAGQFQDLLQPIGGALGASSSPMPASGSIADQFGDLRTPIPGLSSTAQAPPADPPAGSIASQFESFRTGIPISPTAAVPSAAAPSNSPIASQFESLRTDIPGLSSTAQTSAAAPPAGSIASQFESLRTGIPGLPPTAAPPAAAGTTGARFADLQRFADDLVAKTTTATPRAPSLPPQPQVASAAPAKAAPTRQPPRPGLEPRVLPPPAQARPKVPEATPQWNEQVSLASWLPSDNSSPRWQQIDGLTWARALELAAELLRRNRLPYIWTPWNPEWTPFFGDGLFSPTSDSLVPPIRSSEMSQPQAAQAASEAQGPAVVVTAPVLRDIVPVAPSALPEGWGPRLAIGGAVVAVGITALVLLLRPPRRAIDVPEDVGG